MDLNYRVLRSNDDCVRVCSTELSAHLNSEFTVITLSPELHVAYSPIGKALPHCQHVSRSSVSACHRDVSSAALPAAAGAAAHRRCEEICTRNLRHSVHRPRQRNVQYARLQNIWSIDTADRGADATRHHQCETNAKERRQASCSFAGRRCQRRSSQESSSA